jgi:hypothetical protein
MSLNEVTVLKEALDKGQTVVFAPQSNYPELVSRIKDDIIFMSSGWALTLSKSELSDFAILTRLRV